jgi:hypothetical protein
MTALLLDTSGHVGRKRQHPKHKAVLGSHTTTNRPSPRPPQARFQKVPAGLGELPMTLRIYYIFYIIYYILYIISYP